MYVFESDSDSDISWLTYYFWFPCTVAHQDLFIWRDKFHAVGASYLARIDLVKQERSGPGNTSVEAAPAGFIKSALNFSANFLTFFPCSRHCGQCWSIALVRTWISLPYISIYQVLPTISEVMAPRCRSREEFVHVYISVILIYRLLRVIRVSTFQPLPRWTRNCQDIWLLCGYSSILLDHRSFIWLSTSSQCSSIMHTTSRYILIVIGIVVSLLYNSFIIRDIY